MKTCNKCGEAKPLDDFYRDRHAPDGHRYSCKPCDNRRDAQPDRVEARHQYGLSEAGKAAYQRYRATEKGQVTAQRHNASQAAKDYAHSEAYRAIRARYETTERAIEKRRVRDRKESRRQWRVRWYAQPEVRERVNALSRLSCHKRRAAIAQLANCFTEQDWQSCLSYFSNKCAYCGSDGPLEQDHFVPLTKGGPYIPNNIVPACRPCNVSKKNRLPEAWCSSEAYHRILAYVASGLPTA